MERIKKIIKWSLVGVVLANTVFVLPSALANKKKKYRYVEKIYYVPKELVVCSVLNRKSGVRFFGKSPLEKFAKLYARTSCQMQSYQGRCYVKADCGREVVQVRKRRWIKTRIT